MALLVFFAFFFAVAFCFTSGISAHAAATADNAAEGESLSVTCVVFSIISAILFIVAHVSYVEYKTLYPEKPVQVEVSK